MAAADLYRWKFNYRVRQFFNAINPGRAPLTDAQVDAYVIQLNLLNAEIASNNLINKNLNDRIEGLKRALNIRQGFSKVPNLGTNAELNAIYPDANMPNAAQIAAANARIASGVAAVPAAAAPTKPKGRPTGITLTKTTGTDRNNNIVLEGNPPTIYDAIKEGDIRRINAELKDPSFDPEQTFQVTITPPGGAADIEVQLTPLQYAALAGLKGYVRLLLKSKVDVNKKINNLKITDAIEQYRVNDQDKGDIKYIFEIAITASQDASDDYSAGVKLDNNYGNGLTEDKDIALAKMIYTREYQELENPTAPKAPKKTTTGLVEEARKRGKEDAEKGLERSPEYLAKPDLEKNAYQTEYTKYIVEKDKKKGKSDGESGSSKDTSYATKTAEEKEAYGKEYDKTRAAYQGERDALSTQPSDYVGLERDLSHYYNDAGTSGLYKDSIKKIYDDAYEKNRSKTSDLVKEAGYVGTYPPSEAVLSGNFFGFSSELSKIVGFDMIGDTPKTDTDAQYKEGLAKFVENLQSIIGQAKYAGYTDGRKKNTKYTTPGKITVGGKEYAIDFGKLNTRVTELPAVTATGELDVNADFTAAQDVLDYLKNIKNDSTRTLDGMISYIRSQSETNDNSKVKQLLQSIAMSQKGGFNIVQKERLSSLINQLDEGERKTALLTQLNALELNRTDNNETFDDLQSSVTALVIEKQTLELRNLINSLERDQRSEFIQELNSVQSIDELNTLRTQINEAIQQVQTTQQQEQAEQATYRKSILKTKVDRLYGQTQTAFMRRLNDPATDLTTLETEVDTEITTQKDRIRSNLNMLSDGARKQALQERLDSDVGYLYLIEFDVKNALSVNTEINKLQDPVKKEEFLYRFNNLTENLYKVKTDVEKEVFSQTKTISDKKKLIQKGIDSLKDNVVKTDLNDRLNESSTVDQLDLLNDTVIKELNKQETLDEIAKIPVGSVRTAFTTKLNNLTENIATVRSDVLNWINLQKKLKDKIWYIPNSVPEKAGFVTTVNSGETTYAQLQELETNIKPYVPSWAQIVGEKTVKGAKAVGTAVGKAVLTGLSGVASAPLAIPSVPLEMLRKPLATRYGNVTTKAQLYNAVQKALSVIPKYKPTKLENLPIGVSPDDPSLKTNVHPIKRVQSMYDREYERGYKEAMRPTGGTRRKTKKSAKFTKKQKSKK